MFQAVLKSVYVISKHVDYVRIIWTEKLPGAEKFKQKKLMSFSVKNLISFSVHGGTEKDAGLWFAMWVSAQPDTMPNVYRGNIY